MQTICLWLSDRHRCLLSVAMIKRSASFEDSLLLWLSRVFKFQHFKNWISLITPSSWNLSGKITLVWGEDWIFFFFVIKEDWIYQVWRSSRAKIGIFFTRVWGLTFASGGVWRFAHTRCHKEPKVKVCTWKMLRGAEGDQFKVPRSQYVFVSFETIMISPTAHRSPSSCLMFRHVFNLWIDKASFLGHAPDLYSARSGWKADDIIRWLPRHQFHVHEG